jgi:hypothetical protein
MIRRSHFIEELDDKDLYMFSREIEHLLEVSQFDDDAKPRRRISKGKASGAEPAS